MIRSVKYLLVGLIAVISLSPAEGRNVHVGRINLARLDAGMRGAHAHGPYAYVLAEFASVSDMSKLKALTAKLPEELAPLGGRVLASDAAPASFDGASPSLVVLITFNDPASVKQWKDSQPYKDFDSSAQKLSAARVFEVVAAPDLLAQKRDQMRADHERADENLIKMQDQTLKKLNNICNGC